MMAIKARPGVQVNVERTLKTTGKKTVFFDIKPGQSANLRFTPPSNEDGSLFFISVQHFKIKKDGQPRAYACLRAHGDEGVECPMCLFLEAAPDKFTGDLAEKLQRDHGQSYRWHAQVVPVPAEGQERPDQTFVVGLSKMTADDVSKILKMELDNRQVLLTDPDAGQAINITRNTATGFATRYKVLPTGLRVSLDELCPEWTEKFLNVQEAINLRIVDEDEFYAAIAETVGVGLFNSVFPNVKLG